MNIFEMVLFISLLVLFLNEPRAFILLCFQLIILPFLFLFIGFMSPIIWITDLVKKKKIEQS